MKSYTHVIVRINTKNKTEKHRIGLITACTSLSLAKTYQQNQIDGLPGYFEVRLLTKKEALLAGLKPHCICYRHTANAFHLKVG
jgi:hypothetical protein